MDPAQEQRTESLAEQLGAILELGTELLVAGAGAYRVKITMARAAAALGLTSLSSHVTMTSITATARRGDETFTQLAERRHVGTNARLLDALSSYAIHLTRPTSARQLRADLDYVVSRARTYGTWTTVGWAGLACACFCFLNHGRAVECATVLVAAGVGQLVRRLLLGRGYAHFLVWILCAAISTTVYIGLVTGAGAVGIVASSRYEAGIVSSILYLIPGFPLVTAMLDFVRNDMQSAIARLSYCVLIMGSAGFSVWLVIHLSAWQINPGTPTPLPFAVQTGLRVLASGLAVYGFAVLFNASWKVCLFAGVTASITNPSRLLLQESVMPSQLAVCLAAFVVGVIATLVARRTSHTRVSLSVPAVVIMIPGVPLYRGLVALNEGNFISALGTFSQIGFVILAIGLGLALSRVVLDHGWRHDVDTVHLGAEATAGRAY